jgi:allantoin racemase
MGDDMIETEAAVRPAAPTASDAKYRFILIQGFRLPADSPFLHRKIVGTKEETLMDHHLLAPLLEGVEWDLHGGAETTYGNWAVENRQEFMHSGAARLRIVKEACESGHYNAIVLLGGGEPGFQEAREIARPYGVPVVGCAFAQMHIASMLANRFSIIDVAESHGMYYADLVARHRMLDRCASMRMINFPHERPGCEPGRALHLEKRKALAGERSEAVEEAVEAAVAAIEEDGAEAIIFSCSGIFWLQPFVERRLKELGWDLPVLHGYKCAIAVAKMMVDLGVDASALKYPPDRPKRWRKKKLF